MRFIVSSLSPHNQHLLLFASYVFCFNVVSPNDVVLCSSLISHVQICSGEIPRLSLEMSVKLFYSEFSFLIIVILLIIVLFVLFLVAVISLSFLCCLRDVLSKYRRYLHSWRDYHYLFIYLFLIFSFIFSFLQSFSRSLPMARVNEICYYMCSKYSMFFAIFGDIFLSH